MTETPPGQLPDSEPPADVPADARSGYAVYDTVLLRYVGGKHSSKSDADKARKDLDGPSTRYKVRQV